jgi:predicted RNase H-like nuclease (RuvC/YqgF family)
MGKSKSNGLEQKYLAFDILPMSSPSRVEGVKLAVALKLSDGKILEWEGVNRDRLVSIIRKHTPNFVGTDNPTEILRPKESISSFCSRLPVVTNFVHVNLNNQGKLEPLNEVMKKHNLEANKKLNPQETAKQLINLMEKGVGMIIEPFENETIIDVARPRRRGKGGWSQSRYERQGEEIVSRATNDLKSIIDNYGFQYDLISKETKYGAKQSRFHLFESKEVIVTKIKISSLFPAKIKIWSPTKQVVTHRPIEKRIERINTYIYNKHQRLLVGIDPGITTGVAIVSISGKVKSVYSRKNLSKGKLITDLASFGSPVAVCADVSPPPQFVTKIAATYNAQLFSPRSQLNQSEKRDLVRKAFPDNKLNSHERDALSAVLHTLNRFKQSFQKIDNRDLNLDEKEMAKALILRGLSITDALAAIEILRKPIEYKTEFTTDLEENENNIPGRLYNLLGDLVKSEETISNLRSHLGNLELKIENQNKQIKNLEFKLNKIKDISTLEVLKSDIVKQKENQIRHLTGRFQTELKTNQILIERIRDLEQLLWSTLDSDNLPIKVLKRFSKDAIYKLEEEFNIQNGDILLIIDPTGGSHQTARNLAKTKFKIIFIERDKMPTEASKIFEEEGIAVIHSKDYNLRRINQYAMISISELNRALNDYHENFKLEKLRKQSRMINLTIENYQFEREKQLTSNLANYDNYEPEEDETEELPE